MDIPIEKKRSMQALPDDKRWVLLLQSRGTGLLVTFCAHTSVSCHSVHYVLSLPRVTCVSGCAQQDLNKRDSMNKAYRQEEDPNHLAEVLKGQPTVDVCLPSPRPPHCCPPVFVLAVRLTLSRRRK
jgi:hypothetical protein